jgi:hypothetical protein
MSKKKLILLTLLTIVSISAIISGVWATKQMIALQNERTKIYKSGDKTVEAFSTNINNDSKEELPGINPQIYKCYRSH